MSESPSRRTCRTRLFTRIGIAAVVLGTAGWMSFLQYRREALRRPLFDAIKADNPVLVRRLLDRGADPNSRDRSDTPANAWQILLRILHRQTDRKDEEYLSPLMLAARGARPVEIGMMLINGGAKVNARGPHGWTALHHAAASGSGEQSMIRLLAAHDAPIDARADNGATPLITSIQDGRAESVSTLLGLGAHAGLRDKEERDAIFYAAEKGLPDLYEPLLKSGANANTRDSTGDPLIVRAAVSEREDLVRLLYRYGADLNARNGQRSAISCALGYELRDDEVWFAEDKHARPQRRLAILRTLLELGANPNIPDSKGRAPLTRCVQENRPKEAEALLDAGARTDFRFHDATPLMDATSMDSQRLVQLLLDHGADPNVRDSTGNTPVLIAAYCQDDVIRKALLRRGARPESLDAEGFSAAKVAGIGRVAMRPMTGAPPPSHW